MRSRQSHALHGLVRAVIASVVAPAALVACIIETEKPVRRPLLRDSMREAGGAMAALPVPPPVPDAFRACESDADCVAVLPNGCCQDGRNEALNKTLVDAYRSTFACPIASPACPTNLVLDRRVAACDVAKHTCKLVDAPP